MASGCHVLCLGYKLYLYHGFQGVWDLYPEGSCMSSRGRSPREDIQLHRGYVYNIAWLVGVYAIYTTSHRGQRKFTSYSPRREAPRAI